MNMNLAAIIISSAVAVVVATFKHVVEAAEARFEEFFEADLAIVIGVGAVDRVAHQVDGLARGLDRKSVV